MTTFSTLIFDLDGTVAHTLPDVRKAINHTLHIMNMSERSLEQIQKVIGPGDMAFLEAILPGENQRVRDEFLGLFRAYYWDHCLDETRAFPGIPDILDRFRDLHLAVASNKPRKTAERILEGLSLLHYFDFVLGPDDVRIPKPDPEMIVKILTGSNTDPSRALLVGDTDRDLLAARSAGIAFCAARYGYGDMQVLEKSQPDYMIDSAIELVDIIENHQTPDRNA